MTLLCFFIFGLILFLSRSISRFRGDLLPAKADPVVWFIIPWMICLLMFAAPVVVHAEKIRIEHAMYMVACAFVFFLGAVFHQFTREGKKFRIAVSAPADVNRRALKLYALLGIIGFSSILYDQIVVTGFSLTERLSGTNLDAVRQLRNAASFAGLKGPLDRFETLVAFAVIYLTGVVLYYRRDNRQGGLGFGYLLAAIIFCAYLAFSTIFITGGRIQLVLLILVVIGMISLDRTNNLQIQVRSLPALVRRTAIALTLLFFVVSGVLYSTVFVKARMGNVDSILVMKIAHRASPAPWMDSALYASPLLSSAVFQYSYFTAPIATLAYYYDLPEAQFPGPYLGQYNFWGVADRVLRRFDLGLDLNPSIASDDPLNFRGYGGNIWRTALIDYAVDVRLIGVPFVLLFFGYLSRLVCFEAYNRREIFLLSCAAVFLVVIAFTPLHALFNRSAFITGTLFWCILVIFARWVHMVSSLRRGPTIKKIPVNQ